MSYRFVGDGEKKPDVEVDHPLSGYELSDEWEWIVDGREPVSSAGDPFDGFTVADLDRVITLTDMPVDLKLKKADKAVAILVALVGASKADD